MKTLAKYIFLLVILVGVFFGLYHYAPVTEPVVKKIETAISTTLFGSQACAKPITYSLGNFDTRFGMSKSQFLSDVSAAAQIWDIPLHRTLFEYSTAGDLKINLIYDYRQKATSQLQSLGITINDDQTTYDQLKAKYVSLTATYDQAKAALDQEMASFNTAKAAYEQQVSYWNSRGGAPKSEYAALEQERLSVNAQADKINQDSASLNGTADMINSTATILNRIASELNLQVKSYNTIGASTGVEFDEGEYVSDATGQRIDIYQYSSNDKLIRVLAHELGHALGLQHVDDPKAIMYRLNQGTNETPTATDIAELKNVCGIK